MRWHAPTDSRSVYDHVHFGRQVGEKRLLAQKEKRMEIEWCSSEQQLADALTKSMVAWRLINVMKTADIHNMHQSAAKPWTHRRKTVSRPEVARKDIPVTMGFNERSVAGRR